MSALLLVLVAALQTISYYPDVNAAQKICTKFNIVPDISRKIFKVYKIAHCLL